MGIGKNVKWQRQQSGYSLEEFSEKLGIEKAVLVRIERETKVLSLQLALKMSVVLNCSLYDLAGEEEITDEKENIKADTA